MKFAMLVGDGMGDYPVPELDGKTPLEVAETPNMDWIASNGELGLVRTIPDGCETGSDTANLSLLGYDPLNANTRRGPLEAASLGVTLGPRDVAFRCNLVTLLEGESGLTMGDYSAGHISTEEASKVIGDLGDQLGNDTFRFYPGVSYRHLMVWKEGAPDVDTTPPHDIVGEPIQGYLDRMADHTALMDLMEKANLVIKDHPVNVARRQEGRKPANSVWFWGQGLAPSLPSFTERTGLTGAMISAVDLLRGIGVYAGLQIIRVPGATGYFDTDYDAKGRFALYALEDVDFVYVHVEAPDEAGHAGSAREKIAAIEAFDAKVVGKVLKGIKGHGRWRVMVTTDHNTPLSVKTHTTEPVPFALCGSDVDGSPQKKGGGFSESEAKSTAFLMDPGHGLMTHFFAPRKK